MQDVTITAPKTAAISLPQVLSWMAVVNAVKDMLVSQKVAIPGAIADAITKLNQVGAVISSATSTGAPQNVDALLGDLLVILKSVEVTTGHAVIDRGIGDLISAVTWTRTGVTNVENGQFEEVASGTISIAGVEVPVGAAVYRKDKGTAAITLGYVQGDPSTTYAYTQAEMESVQTQLTDANATIATLSAQVQALQQKIDLAPAPAPASAPAPSAGSTVPSAPAAVPPQGIAPIEPTAGTTAPPPNG